MFLLIYITGLYSLGYSSPQINNHAKVTHLQVPKIILAQVQITRMSHEENSWDKPEGAH